MVYIHSFSFVIHNGFIFNIYFKEEACKQPVAIMTAVSFVIMLPINMGCMFMIFTHLNKIFNPNNIRANVRHAKRLRKFP